MSAATDKVTLSIALTGMRGKIPTDLSVEERLAFAFRYVREHSRDLFFMQGSTSDDELFRCAVAAVMVPLDPLSEEHARLTNSIKALQAMSALFIGVPVDLEAMQERFKAPTYPLMKLWHESEKAHGSEA